MNPAISVPIDAKPHTVHAATRSQIRGSSLLLIGRLLAVGVNFAVQVLIVRHLSKTEYGAFQYALSIVAFGDAIATLGMDQAITRLIPIYHERGEYNKLFGAIAMVVSAILLIGLATVLLVWGFHGFIAQSLIGDQKTVALLLILIVLAPIGALDGLILAMFAVLENPRSIFFRRYVLGPGLKLAVVLLLLLWKSDVFFLAGGYLTVTALGTAVSAAVLFRAVRDQGLLQHFDRRTLKLPTREVLTFALPLMTTDLMYLVMNTTDAMLLEHFQGTVGVAALRAVQPTAKLNQMVLLTFGLLFTPLASRLYARNDSDGMKNMYWQTAIWTAVVSFPIFAVSFSLARPLTLTLYGQRYADSAVILMLLSFGYYFNAALGHNGLMLRVHGKIRYTVAVNILAVAINLGINLALIPRYGALGAAIGTGGTLVAHNILKQIGLRLKTGISLFEWRYFKLYAAIALSTVGLLLFQLLTSSPLYVGFALAAFASLVVVGLNRKSLNVGETFPEVLRFPLARRLFGE
jgi:O-antigen/teichoic acid export membrane protein